MKFACPMGRSFAAACPACGHRRPWASPWVRLGRRPLAPVQTVQGPGTACLALPRRPAVPVQTSTTQNRPAPSLVCGSTPPGSSRSYARPFDAAATAAPAPGMLPPVSPSDPPQPSSACPCVAPPVQHSLPESKSVWKMGLVGRLRKRKLKADDHHRGTSEASEHGRGEGRFPADAR